MPDSASRLSRIPFRRVTCVAVLGICVLATGCATSRDDGVPGDCDTAFSLLNPRWRCEKDEPPKSQEYDMLLNDLIWRIDDWKKRGMVTHVSVYFRDLENGTPFGIGGTERFAPASLLKVPVMIALFKYSESHPAVMEDEVAVGDLMPDLANLSDPDKTLLPGKTYTVREALRRMIVYSDNTAKEVLRLHLESLSPGIMDQTFVDLGISLQNPDGSAYITVRSYASLFRTLFNGSYLNRTMSQQALKLLSEAEFDDGIVAGLPPNIETANKFGFVNADGVTEEQLHDCGIIYHPKKPYLLCVMTRGHDDKVQSSVIADISKAVYKEVSLRQSE